MAWNAAIPTSASYIKDIPTIFQANWTAAEDIMGVQHYTYSSALSGRHKPGITPLMAADSTTNLDALTGVHDGAISFDTTLGLMKRYDGTASAWKQINLASLPIADVYKTGDQTIATRATPTSYTAVQFDTELKDVMAAFDSTTNYTFTAPTAGYYLVHVNVSVTSTDSEILWKLATAVYDSTPTLQYSSLVQAYSVDTNTMALQNSSVFYLDKSDIVGVAVQHDDAASQTLEGGEDLTFIQIYKIS